MKQEMATAFDSFMLDSLIELIGSGEVDHVVNRNTSPDEMYRIWALCQKNSTIDIPETEKQAEQIAV